MHRAGSVLATNTGFLALFRGFSERSGMLLTSSAFLRWLCCLIRADSSNLRLSVGALPFIRWAFRDCHKG
eukprot:6650823-Alexandrium_andersonii.AAC.1